jgi:holo-[acyl-carrier protein] synthase
MAVGQGHVLGVGVDLVEVARVERLLCHSRAAWRLFTPGERAAAGEGAMRAQRLAARFAAKEAVVKALGGVGALGFHDIEVVRPEGEAARVRLTGRAAERARERGVREVLVSMSHVGAYAVAHATAVGECPCAS